MIEKSEVCVLIPAYNEEKKIELVLGEIRARGWNLYVVDDGSSDSTPQKIRSLGVRAELSEKNEGKGASLRKGLAWLKKSSFKAAVLMDADGQHSPDEIERFVEALNAGADVVVGNRMANPDCMPFIRVATNRFMSWVISRAAGQRVPDSQCGFRALGRRAIEAIRLEADRFETESEMILRASDAGLSIASVPIACVYGGETSHIRPGRDTARFFSFLCRYLLDSKTRKKGAL